MLNAGWKRQCWLSRHSRSHLCRCRRPSHRPMMSRMRQRHSLPSSGSLDLESPTSEVTLRCLPLYHELTGLLDVLRTPAGTSAIRQRNLTFSYERLVSRTSLIEDREDCDDHIDDHETRLATTLNQVQTIQKFEIYTVFQKKFTPRTFMIFAWNENQFK